MNIAHDLNRIVEKWNLLNHPFYKAWSDGVLPLDSLRLYAKEYGAFIGLLPDGWRALDISEYAEEEVEHIELWEKFASSMNAKISEPEITEVSSLIETSKRMFQNPASAAGAMYAFEKQQPATAKSKLDGLRKFYDLPAELVEPYFIEHTNNEHESDLLIEICGSFSDDEKSDCLDACDKMGEALWNALNGIYKNRDCNPPAQ